jgi:hypothetical protein
MQRARAIAHAIAHAIAWWPAAVRRTVPRPPKPDRNRGRMVVLLAKPQICA